ncbi:hypothetical protein [Eupransor demetentiae]|uniref:Uncharacterized protein n=1 Tax=Eupransor demetentiae TaxID=3109584 RepID=A0ABM9N3J0_9LACO|nr:hypothetical protein R54876_GBNLAHCA_00276 [Lactobacillaceae bacterium LMG 33000]
MAKIVNKEERTNSPLDDLIALPKEESEADKAARKAALGKESNK